VSELNLTELLRNRLDLFYVLALAPLLPIQYFGYVARNDFFAALIPLYGFLLLLFKKDKLSAFAEPERLHRLLGVTIMLASPLAYYAVVPFFPSAQLYGVANYTIFIIGLFLYFFEIPALKESFATLFLIAAAISTPPIGNWLQAYLEPAVPYFVQIMWVILKILGIPITIAHPRTFGLQMQDGTIMYLGFEAGCIGIDSFLTFAVIITVVMIEDPCNLRTKLLWSIAGIIGTFIVNIIRVSLIFAVIYYFGYKNWGILHSRIGYVLFMIWLAFFFLIFLKRQAILSKLQTFWRGLRQTLQHSKQSENPIKAPVPDTTWRIISIQDRFSMI
jgi:exosortase/archaeosortase family protein